MSNKLKGTLLGIAASLVGVGLYILLYIGLELIGGIACVLMGVLFILVYNKFNSEDASKYKYIVAGVVTFIEVIASEFICLAIIVAQSGYASLGHAFDAIPNLAGATIYDLVFGLIFGAVGLGAYIFSKTRKTINSSHKRIKTDVVEPNSVEEVKEEEEK